jgi:hypothetical protein
MSLARPLLGALAAAAFVIVPMAHADSPATPATPAAPSVKGELTVQQVADLLTSKAAVHLYDANGSDTYASGHVPTATWIDEDNLDKVAADFFPADKGAELVFYCANEH